MKTLKITAAVVMVFAAMLFACKKNHSNEKTLSEKLTVDAAEAYHKASEAKYGNFDLVNIFGKTEKNFKKVDFSHAYVGENETSFFVEVPISYTKRQIMLRNNSGIPKATLQRIVSKSFDRLVIYKDKVSGMIMEKIATTVPSIDYLTSGYKDLHDNHFQNMVNDFSGYVTYKNWKGEFLTTILYNSGKVSNDQKLSVNRLKTESFNTGDESCDNGTLYTLYFWCEDFDENGNGVNCDWTIIESPVLICTHYSPTFTPGGASPVPNVSDPYWEGWPEPQTILPPSGCPGTPRSMESPIIWAAVSGSNFSATMYDACFCQGYSWFTFEDINTGAEYSVPISNQAFLPNTCDVQWETHFQIPANIPQGQYFLKVNLDGDVFYWQAQNSAGIIVKRYSLII